MGVGYVFRLVPGKARWYRLKDFPYLKSFCVATGWAMGGVGITRFSRAFGSSQAEWKQDSDDNHLGFFAY